MDSATGNGSPVMRREAASNGAAISVPSRPNIRWPAEYNAHDSTWTSVVASFESSTPIRTRAGFAGGQQVPTTPVNRKWRPSGRNHGNRWLDSPYWRSRTPAACGAPPALDTRWSGPFVAAPKTITLSRFHVPPRPLSASHSTTGGPPLTLTFFSLPAAKNPMYWLSG